MKGKTGYSILLIMFLSLNAMAETYQEKMARLDPDRDGYIGEEDLCPDEPETLNGFDDTDGCPDKAELLVSLTPEKIEIKEQIHFKPGTSVIDVSSFNLLNQVASLMKAHTEIDMVRIEGHTDSRGTKADNLKLSQKRAESLSAYLVDQGVEAERLLTIGYGENQPIASNATLDGRTKNRRVEFMVERMADGIQVAKK